MMRLARPRAACAALLALALGGCVLDAPFETETIRREAFDAYHRGEELAVRGRHGEALEQYLQAVELSPRPAFLQRAGSMHREMGHPERALFYFDKALELEPGFEAAAAERELARLEITGRLLEQGRPDMAYSLQAAPAQAEAVEVEAFTAPASDATAPGPVAEPREIATPYESMTAADFRDVLFPELGEERGGDLARLRAEAESASAGNRWLSAVNLWGRLAVLEPGDLVVRLEHARALDKSGRTRRALEEFETVAREFPEAADAWFRLGNALAASGRMERAKEAYQRAVELEPGNAMVQNNLGALHLNAGQFEPAARHFEGAIAADPAMAAPHLNLALALDSLGGDPARALHHLEEYLRLGGERRRDAEDWLVDLRAKADGNVGAP